MLSVLCLIATLGMPAQGAPTPDGATTRLEDAPDQGAFVIRVGPMNLPASHGDHHEMHGGVFPPVATVTIPKDAYLYGFDYEIRDSAGRLLPTSLLHHMNLLDPMRRELFLPIAQRVLAIGRETGAKAMPWLLFGLPVSRGQDLVVSVMMHNPTHQSYTGVTFALRLKYVPATRPWPLLRVYPFQLDVAFPAGDKSFDLPPGPSSRSYEARPALAGRIMAIGAHLHDYANGITFEDVTEGRVLWEGKPHRTASGEITGVSVGRLYWKLGLKIVPDHTYRVTVTYDNPTGQSIPDGGMGVVGGVFIPAGDVAWPAADPSDPLYVLDLKHYRREIHGKYADLVAALRGGTP